MEITPEAIESYCVDHSSKVHEIFSELAAATKEKFPQAFQMQVGPMEGQFLAALIKITGAKQILEFGTFTGCSSLAMALALPVDGKIITLDRDPVATEIARTFWRKAGVDTKIEFILGDAKETLKTLEQKVALWSKPFFDFAFIDADKAGYENYFEAALRIVKPGGCIAVDNVLWGGAVLNPEDKSDFVICKFNDRFKNDPRVQSVMLPVRDGVTLFYKN